MRADLLRWIPVFSSRSAVFNFHVRTIHDTVPLSAGSNWRKEQGMPANPNAYGPLTDLPDYTFLDGRRTPVGPGKLRRALVQQNLAEKIMKLSSEIDFAIDRRKQLDAEEEHRKQSILNRKLKSKGEQAVVRKEPMGGKS